MTFFKLISTDPLGIGSLGTSAKEDIAIITIVAHRILMAIRHPSSFIIALAING